MSLTPGTTLAYLRLLPGSVASTPQSPSPPCRGHVSHQIRALVMKIEQFAGHQEAREALVLAIAGVTTIMVIESLILLILY